MPVQIQCTAVVVLNSSLDRCLEGGVTAFNELVTAGVAYADDDLSQCSFMSEVDAEEFAKTLEIRGLSRDPTAPDFAIVRAHDQSVEPTCEWLTLFEYESRLIATLTGSTSTKVMAPADERLFDPEHIQHYSQEEIERDFEFVERKGLIDTYREKATGRLVYHTRQTETPDETFRRLFAVVWENKREIGAPPATGDQAVQLQSAIGELQALNAKYPGSANAELALGMAWFGVGNHENAVNAFQRASNADPENTAVLKEWAGVCLVMRDWEPAVEIATRAVTLAPDDVELLGNYAVIKLLAGNTADAQKAIQHALKLAPDDAVNRNLATIIADVSKGRREQPDSLESLMQPPKKKPGFLKRLFGG